MHIISWNKILRYFCASNLVAFIPDEPRAAVDDLESGMKHETPLVKQVSLHGTTEFLILKFLILIFRVAKLLR
jgi:hypothetical protein